MTEEDAYTAYWRRSELAGARPLVIRAIEAFAAEFAAAGRDIGRDPPLAVDLGCGVGRDALKLLAEGWRVLAIDASQDAITRLRERSGSGGVDRHLETRVMRLERATLPMADLVVASFSLFLPRADLLGAWTTIRAALRPGARFTGQFIGPEDDWAARPDIASFTADEVADLLAGLEVEHLAEEHDDAITPRGRTKHWHLWHVLARRP